MRQTVPDILPLAARLREQFETDKVAARGWTFALASSDERSFGSRCVWQKDDKFLTAEAPDSIAVSYGAIARIGDSP